MSNTSRDSLGPLYPKPSDNPNLVVGALTSITNWLKSPFEWISSLSPAGATVYDTGVLESGLSFTLTSNAADLTYKAMRRGKTAFVRVDVTYKGPTQTGGAGGNVVDQELFTFPPGWRPWDVTYDIYLGSPGSYEVGARIEASGVVRLVTAPPGTTITQGDPLRLNARLELP